MPMRIVFCGTPQFAVPPLRHILAQPDFEVAAVITQPDRPSGRGQKVAPSPVKQAAIERGIPILQPEHIQSPEAERALRGSSADAVVLIAYGQIIPVALLALPRLGWINLHASLLPKYRGAAPIQWAIARGERKTGLTTMKIDAGTDTGEILLQQEMLIGPEESAPELSTRMAEAGAPLMAATLRGLATGEVIPRAQEPSGASYAPLLRKADGQVDWSQSAETIYNRIRGFAPWPGVYAAFRGQICHVWGRPFAGSVVASPDAPGTIRLQGEAICVVCGEGTQLELLTLQLEGRKRICAREFASGFRLRGGESFSAPGASKESG
jgi:methionyl-tRNA formyltransferase